MTTEREAEILDASAGFYAAVNRLQRGDPGPMLARWSHAPDVTNMGPQGGRQEGWEAVRAYWEEAARRAAASSAAVTAAAGDLVIRVVGDLAYACGTERVRIVRDGATTEIEPRATNIFRREGGVWKLVHRHADTA